MTIRAKELLLHRMIATSAFVFALCILPVSQYLLLGKGPASALESGSVAGASTDQTIIAQDIAPLATADPAICEKTRQTDLTNLDTTLNGYITHTQEEEEASVQTYLASSTQQVDATRNAQIASIRIPYEKRISDWESAVLSQKNIVASRSCLPE